LEPVLILASASPRRAQILTLLGVAFRVSVSDVQEMLLPGESGAIAAERLARAKAAAVGQRERLPVLAADTVVLCEGRVLGKPASVAEAADMLRQLAGRTHEVVTGVCVRARGSVHSGTERTAVTMGPMSEDEIGWYAASGEPLDKAGAYHVDGRGALFIESVQGSPSNVAGLPVRLLLRLVREAGLSLGLP
jgi:nucleoside triphosphate pyrophosphatase